MTAHSGLRFEQQINNKFDCADGLGAARPRHRFASRARSILSLTVGPIRSARRASARYTVVFDAIRRAKAGQFQPTAAPVAVESP
jgi:hypothetical protein